MAEPRAHRIKAEGRELDVWVALPEATQGRTAALQVVHEIFGVDRHMLDVAQRFAREGFVAVAPNLFTGELQALLSPANVALAMRSFAEAPADLRRDPSKFAAFAASQPPERRPVLEAFARVTSPTALAQFARELLACAEFVRSLPEVDPDRVGCLGFCFGGSVTARLATLDPRLRAAVVFYGQSPPAEDIPRIRASVLGLYGSEDPGLTGTVPAFAEAMRAAGSSFEYHVYPGARHAFFNDTRASNYHAESAADAWPRVLIFLQRHLAPLA